MTLQHINHKNSGATLVEVLVAIALAGIMFPVLAIAIISSNNARPSITQQLLASGQLQELLTAVRSVREQNWTDVTTDGTYHPIVSGSGWGLASGSESTGGFTEAIQISDVQRNGSGSVVASGGTIDPSTKLVTATVSWTTPTSSSVSSDLYLSRWQAETGWTQTTVTDFSGNTLTNTSVTNTSGGEVQLSTGQTSGSLESSSFDAGSTVGFNYLSFTATQPAGTSIEFQVASNNDNATWSYVGPDGTSSSYFTAPGAIPLNNVSGRYIRYKATFTGAGSNTPVLDDVTITYSP